MHSVKRLKISELNPHLICVLCGGYYIDATTITECLHTFCKTCIVGYLEASKHCPVCDTLVHKSTPHIRLRPDDTLQDLVYKLVPGLFKDEMKKRRDFYKDEIESGKLDDTPDAEARERIVFSADELFSLALELSPSGSPPYNPSVKVVQHKIEPSDCRYLQCPAAITIGHLKKFVRMKFNLCDRYQIDLYHTDESLNNRYTLMDVAYIYSWRRKGPLQLYYSVYTNPAKRFKSSMSPSIAIKPSTEQKAVVKKVDTSTPEIELKTNAEIKKVKGRRRKVSKGAASAKIPTHDKIVHTIESNGTSSTVMNDECDITPVDVDSEAEKRVLQKVVKCVDKLDVKSEMKQSDKVDTSETDEKNDSGIIQDIETDMDTSDVVHTEFVEESRKVDAGKVDMEEKVDHMTAKDVCESNEVKQATVEDMDVSNKPIDKSKLNAEEEPSKLKAPTKKDCESIKETKDCETNTPEPSSYSSEIYSSAIDTKRSAKEDIVSEPIVSSTQNTQSCQTEPPCADQMDLPLSCESDNAPSTSISDSSVRSTVDASCETDTAELSGKMSKEGISVSTETDVNDFYKEAQTLKTVGSSTDVKNLPIPINTDTSVDSSTTTDTTMPQQSISSTATSHIPTITPLSPTKIAVSFSPPPSPIKSLAKSPSRSETTGFQSQYHSFVMDLPDTSDEFEGLRKATNLIAVDTLSDSKDSKKDTLPVMPQLKCEEVTKKGASSKTGRPRGRPPKNKPPEIKMEGHPVKKPKKHKSRSHSPKQPRNNDKSGKQSFRRYSHSVYDSTMLNTQSLTDKHLDNRHRHKSDSQAVTPNEEQKIPKQVLYFSNGQYTITTASGLNRLKQSSPISPTQTVTETQTASYGDKIIKDKKQTSSINQTETKSIRKQSVTEKVVKSKKQPSDKAIVKNVMKPDKHSANCTLSSKMTHSITDKLDMSPMTPIAMPTDIHKPLTDIKTQKSGHMDKAHTSDFTKQPETSSEPKVSAKSPEYRHQSPYFASISGARMPTHRPSTFLNIPVINSTFSASHLFSPSSYRYGNERLAVPLYRSKSLQGDTESSDKSNGTPRCAEKQNETISSHSNIVSCQTPFYVPHPAYIYQYGTSPTVPSMPFVPPHNGQKSAVSPCGYSPDSTKSPVNLKSDLNGINIPQNNPKNIKSNSAVRKNKEKSIDNVITAIHEMKSKSEPTYSEQINGIDLSTKSIARQSEAKSKFTNNNKDVDKYAFTDDDESRVNSNLRNYKPDIQAVRKSAI